MASPEQPDTHRSNTGTAGASPGSGPLFEAEGVSVRFGGLVALDDASLSVAPHRVHGVIGPNGAGKTTLFNVCCGFVRPSSGRLTWRGSAIPELRPHRLAGMGIARTLQGVGLFPGLSVVDNVMVGADHRRRAGFLSALFALPRSDTDERRLRAIAMAALRELDADSYADRFPASLPYPVQKRVAMARALAAEPELLLLDEPASGLGYDEITELGALVRTLATRMSVVVVDHHMDLVMSICDRITVLDFGRVVATGTPEEVRDDPAVIDAYLGEDARSPERSRDD
ncbi:branched-chain amino acid transport system ATP-binding protein [Halopolyspora algeriensis]|uniref:Branched-chain amino acid transport system ATP-binding protein n=1 Tax=Halopolyspora algeriensis TaxID=1500506 RepID=A0A368VXZ1_9ACTN|nr:ABC transporter ATP-binding protein [Halopolyspora algeriensis]RCW45712.1 branched-chain amino acid transport system ATP-binding protein [Halopolyspora algeriensis]TQM54096.1 branched-chain amino acid transport system ATP-binding protein [Halopolyspora algeriensis]